jgi:hypothetical protein
MCGATAALIPWRRQRQSWLPGSPLLTPPGGP